MRTGLNHSGRQGVARQRKKTYKRHIKHAITPPRDPLAELAAAGREGLTAQRFERADILRRCQSEPLSVAELSALMRIPIGVVRVVAADMVAEGLLESFQPSTNVADDVLLITRLIAGVRSL